MVQYILVCFWPNGRLPQRLYFVYVVPIWILLYFVTTYVNFHLETDEEQLSVWLLAPVIALYWMSGCVVARRLRDCGWSGALPVALSVLLTYEACSAFFPVILLGQSEDMQANSIGFLGLLFFAGKWLFRFTCTAALFKDGDSGANCYGEPLGKVSAETQALRDQKRNARLREEFGDRIPKPKPQGKLAKLVPAKPKYQNDEADTNVVESLLAGRSTRVINFTPTERDVDDFEEPAASRGSSGFGRRVREA